MRIGTLFSGIGAPEQGAKRVYGDDLEMVFACEFDKFARQSYMANYCDGLDESEGTWAYEHFWNDVHNLDATEYRGEVDILIGGSPCQAFSIAGLRHGTEDVRGQLIYQYIRIVEECLPPVIVYENVKGMMSIGGGKTIKEFVQALREIGYFCHYEVINTKDYGIPQNRERLFLVGFMDHEVYHRFSYGPKYPLSIKLKDILEDEVEDKYFIEDDFTYTEKKISNVEGVLSGGKWDKINESACRVYDINEHSAALCAFGGGHQEQKIRISSATKCGYEIARAGDGINLAFPKTKTGRGKVGKQVAQALVTSSNAGVVLEDMSIRKLTPRECLRLQDFPDSFKQVVSNSQMYKQAGNSMSVNILEMIFRQIERAKAGHNTNSLMDFLGENNDSQ